MQWRYRNAPFPANAVSHTTAKTVILTETGIPSQERTSVTLSGTLIGDSQLNLSQQQGQIERAVAIPYGDLVLIGDGGIVISALWNRTSLTGVRKVEGPSWDGAGASYSTFLNFSGLKFEADYPLPTGGPVLLDFLESCSSRGGNYPERVFARPVNAHAILQQIYPSEPFVVVQRGSSTHLRDYFVPPPLWPAYLLRAPEIDRIARRVGPQVVHFQSTWLYQMGTTHEPLIGRPNVPPTG